MSKNTDYVLRTPAS